MSSAESQAPGNKHVSMTRVTIMLVPLLIIVGAGAYFYSTEFDPEVTSTNRRIEEVVQSTFGLGTPTQNTLGGGFTDADDDLVADPPSDESQWLDPDPIYFSYVASEDSEGYERLWQSFADFLAERTGRKVEYVKIASINDQLLALHERRLHVTGLNTGAVPLAVNAHGFIPVCTYGADDGSFGYRMKIIVAESSLIRSVEDLRGRNMAFTHMSSNSGFRAPLVALMNDYGLMPETDYTWAFSGSHGASIRGLMGGQYDAAAVASDMLERAVASGEIDIGETRSIYESERFPPAALGYVHDLKPELAASIRQALLDFRFADTPLAEEFASANGTRFVPISYKDDWALIRRIQDATGVHHTAD